MATKVSARRTPTFPFCNLLARDHFEFEACTSSYRKEKKKYVKTYICRVKPYQDQMTLSLSLSPPMTYPEFSSFHTFQSAVHKLQLQLLPCIAAVS